MCSTGSERSLTVSKTHAHELSSLFLFLLLRWSLEFPGYPSVCHRERERASQISGEGCLTTTKLIFCRS